MTSETLSATEKADYCEAKWQEYSAARDTGSGYDYDNLLLDWESFGFARKSTYL